MSRTDFIASFDFDIANWGVNTAGFVALSASEQASVQTALLQLYDGSDDFRTLVSGFSGANHLRLAKNTDTNPGLRSLAGFIGVNPGNISNTYWMNDKGTLVQEDLRLTLTHEIKHLTGGGADPTDAYGSGNGSHDYKGPSVLTQNEVAGDLGLHEQVAYFAFVQSLTGDLRYGQVTLGASYSRGEQVDIAVIDAAASSSAVDLSSRNDGSRIALLG